MVPRAVKDARIVRPLRSAVRRRRRAAMLRRRAYGRKPPSWWPRRLDGLVGPRSPHDDVAVTLFAGPRRYELQPASMGERRGHVFAGEMRPGAAELEEALARLGHPADAALTLATISSFEGGFDTLQTYARGKLAWGFIQFTADGGLPALMQRIKAAEPAVFAECFTTPAGLDVDEEGRLTIRDGGRVLRGRAVLNRLHDEPSLWRCFLLASAHEGVRDAQVDVAFRRFYEHPLRARVPIGEEAVALGDLFAGDEYGRGVVCDRAVSTGVGHAIGLFSEAVLVTGARDPSGAAEVLAWVREAEAIEEWRFEGLEEALTRRQASPARAVPRAGG